jgi:hypothetical protein
MKLELSLAALFGLASAQHGHGGMAMPKGVKIEKIQSQFSPNNQRVRVTHGLYSLPPYNLIKGGHAGMENEGGLVDVSNPNAPKPCSDCTLKYAKGFLVNPDGTNANFANGAYLHHLTLSVKGPNRTDVACPNSKRTIGMERMLAIHNDRNETFYGMTATDKMGFYLGKDDTFDLELVLKNEVNVPKNLTFSIEWEFVPGRPAGYADVKGVWIDAAPCDAKMSDIPPPSADAQFTLTAKDAWTAPYNGRFLNTVGHMHDGGVKTEILVNDVPVCTSEAVYDGSPDYIVSPKAISEGAKKMSHISRYTPCLNIGEFKKGDQVRMRTSYDFSKWKPAYDKIGHVSHVMGLSLVLMEIHP